MGVLSNGLNLMNVDPYVLEVITGTIIVIAVLPDSLKRRRPGQIKVQNRCGEVEAFDEEEA